MPLRQGTRRRSGGFAQAGHGRTLRVGAPILLLLSIGFIGCQSSDSDPAPAWRAQWAAEWNARLEPEPVLRDHPCGDFAFDPWVQDFLAPCETYGGAAEMTAAHCEAREAWAWERSRQCNVWQEWLLRNHHKHSRESAPEPNTRVEL